MNKSVRGTRGPFLNREAAMAEGQPVAVFGERLASVVGGVGMVHAVMQVNLDFSPASMAVLGQHLQQALVVLLGGIEVGVDQRTAIMVAPAVDDFGIFARPPFQATLLLVARDALIAVFRDNGGFEMIGPGEDQVHGPARRRLQRAPSRRRQDLSGVGDLSFETHGETLFATGFALAVAQRAATETPISSISRSQNQLYLGRVNGLRIRWDGGDATATRLRQSFSNPGTSVASPARVEFFPSWQSTPPDRLRGAGIRSLESYVR